MTLQEALVQSAQILKKIAFPNSAFEAEILLSHVLGKRREYLLAHPCAQVKTTQQKKFFTLIQRRQTGEPIAYLTQTQTFCGLEFIVNQKVLIPRPETELLVALAQENLPHLSPKPILVDLGTGSGCIAVTLAKLFPALNIYAVDISGAALRIARQNARKYGVRNIKFRQGNLLEALPSFFWKDQTPKMILANLPYLSTRVYKNFQAILKYEPRSALWGGRDGLKYYRLLCKQLKLSWQPARAALIIALEIDPEQVQEVRKITLASSPHPKIEIKKDLAGLDRFVVFQTRNILPL